MYSKEKALNRIQISRSFIAENNGYFGLFFNTH